MYNLRLQDNREREVYWNRNCGCYTHKVPSVLTVQYSVKQEVYSEARRGSGTWSVSGFSLQTRHTCTEVLLTGAVSTLALIHTKLYFYTVCGRIYGICWANSCQTLKRRSWRTTMYCRKLLYKYSHGFYKLISPNESCLKDAALGLFDSWICIDGFRIRSEHSMALWGK